MKLWTPPVWPEYWLDDVSECRVHRRCQHCILLMHVSDGDVNYNAAAYQFKIEQVFSRTGRVTYSVFKDVRGGKVTWWSL